MDYDDLRDEAADAIGAGADYTYADVGRYVAERSEGASDNGHTGHGGDLGHHHGGGDFGGGGHH